MFIVRGSVNSPKLEEVKGHKPVDYICDADRSLIGKKILVEEYQPVNELTGLPEVDVAQVPVVDENGYPVLESTQVQTMVDGELVSVAMDLPTYTVSEVPRLALRAVVDIAGQAALDAAKSIEDAANAKIAKFNKRYDFARQVKVRIAIINQSKSMDIGQTQVYLSDPVIQRINALITDISFVSAKAVIDAADLSGYYSSAEVTELSDMIGDYLAEEAS